MRSFWGVFLVSVSPLILSYVVGSRDIRETWGRAEATTAKVDITGLSAALHIYRMNHGVYPTSTDELQTERLISSVPVDPWGNPYIYRVPGRSEDFEVYTLGADGREGGSGADADIGSWAL